MIALKTLNGLNKLIVTALCLVATALVVAPPALALPNDPFTPDFSTCTDVNPCTFKNPVIDHEDPFTGFYGEATYAGTTRAGANPDLTITMQRKRNGCREPGSDEPKFGDCIPPDTLYLEQDLRKIVQNLPPGLMGDVNAAPYCDAYQTWGSSWAEEGPIPVPGIEQMLIWGCANPNAAVGTVVVLGTSCGPDVQGQGYAQGCLRGVADDDTGLVDIVPLTGVVYNERPQPGEQGRLAIIVPTVRPWDLPDYWWMQTGGVMKVDVSLKVRESDLGIDAIVEPIPPGLIQDEMKWNGTDWDNPHPVRIPFQISEMMMSLKGSIGAEDGHPLLTNPTFCDKQSVGAEIQGYAKNSKVYYQSQDDDFPADVFPGEGIGDTVTPSSPYQATGCDSIPYSPNFTATSDTDAPGKPVALSTTITQKDNEATTKKVDVEFPKGMGINIGTTLKPCTAETPNRSNCPDSLMGTVEAESRLLPVKPPNNGPLKGDVFLTEQKGNRLSLAVMLSGFINVRFNATAGVDSSGRLTATFDDLPSVPLTKFTLNLAGGNKSLITNPRRCGDLTTKATFTSHSGKTRVVSVPAAIKGCSSPVFDVDLSEPGKGKRTGIELEVRSDEKPIKEVKFGIDRHMKLSAKGLGKKRKFGEISVTSDSGMKEAALKRPVGIKQKKKKGFSLKVSALKGLGINIYRKRFKRQGVKNFKNKKNKKALKKKTVLKNRVSVKPLPKDGLTKVSVSLNPDEAKLLRNGKNKCRANFIALVKTTDGVKYALKQTVKLRGKGCSKKKKAKKKS